MTGKIAGIPLVLIILVVLIVTPLLYGMHLMTQVLSNGFKVQSEQMTRIEQMLIQSPTPSVEVTPSVSPTPNKGGLKITTPATATGAAR